MVIDRSLFDVAVRATFTTQPVGTMTCPQPPVRFRAQALEGRQGHIPRYASSDKVAVHIHRGVFDRQSILHEQIIALGLSGVTAHSSETLICFLWQQHLRWQPRLNSVAPKVGRHRVGRCAMAVSDPKPAIKRSPFRERSCQLPATLGQPLIHTPTDRLGVCRIKSAHVRFSLHWENSPACQRNGIVMTSTVRGRDQSTGGVDGLGK